MTNKGSKKQHQDATKGQVRNLENEIRSLRKLVSNKTVHPKTRRKETAPRPKAQVRQTHDKVSSDIVAHANILMDPCMASLPPPLPSSGGATVGRYTYAYSGLPCFTGSTYAVFTWRPSYVSYYSFSRTSTTSAMTDASALAANVVAMPAAPFYNMLQSNFRSHRVMGACLKATYTGKEIDATGMAYSFYSQHDLTIESTI